MMLATAWENLAANLPATITALGALIVSIGTFYQSYQNGKKADRAAEQAEVAAKKADVVAAETSTIKTNTDGNLKAHQHDIDLLRQEIDALNKARELAAVSVALATPAPGQPVVMVEGIVKDVVVPPISSP